MPKQSLASWPRPERLAEARSNRGLKLAVGAGNLRWLRHVRRPQLKPIVGRDGQFTQNFFSFRR